MAKSKPRRPAPRAPAAPPKKPIGKWIGYAVAAGFVVMIGVIMFNTPEEVPGGIPEGTEAVLATDRNHIEGPISYDRLVPAGGNHNPIWLQCGIYDRPVATENAVHTLEHGAVWITYQPDIGSGAINTLENASRVRSKTILSPMPGQASPVMATAWGWQLELADAGDVRLRQFVQQFEGAKTVPEPSAAC